jgi:hypothetical protein
MEVYVGLDERLLPIRKAMPVAIDDRSLAIAVVSIALCRGVR